MPEGRFGRRLRRCVLVALSSAAFAIAASPVASASAAAIGKPAARPALTYAVSPDGAADDIFTTSDWQWG